MIYEFITPSDPITFKADDDKIAYACCIVLSNGKGGCTREDGVDVPCLFIFHPDPMPEITKYLGKPIDEFIDANIEAVALCFKSFAYGSISDRRSFDDAVDAITDPEKLKDFLAKHEDRQRTSVSKWVKSAWRIGEKLQQKV